MPAVPKSVVWSNGELQLLDQTRLPHAEVYLACRNVESVAAAISNLSVRGAPAIGIAAAYGLVVGLDGEAGDDNHQLMATITKRARCLVSARPTAVNLAWSVNRMLSVADAIQNEEPGLIIERLVQEAELIHEEDAAACRAIGRYGLELVKARPRLLTHCNAGALAVSELGTALAPIYMAHEQGVPVHLFVDETRPLLQGARLTAYELTCAGVDFTLIADNMAAHFMARGDVDAVIVGADRVAANGDVANKIGTLNLAILCQYYGLPFYVACPASTIDLATMQGADIVIEERDPDEVTSLAGQSVSPANVRALNPAFDVTPAKLVTAIVTDRGIVQPPLDTNLATIFGEHI
ncbi:MAG: S-methyl-5-thioribose-1-phosphate isomerase [Pseudomonadales bacterium]